MKSFSFLFALAFITQMLNAQPTNTSVLSIGTWYKIAVTETGIYKISYNDLLDMGIDPASVNPKNIRIYGNGVGMLPELNSEPRYDDLQENAIMVIGEDNEVFDVEDYILFYGEDPVVVYYDPGEDRFKHQVNYYTDSTYYYLCPDIGAGKRIPVQDSEVLTSTHQVTSFNDYAYHEKDSVNLIKSGKKWFGEHFSDQMIYEFEFVFPNLEVSSLHEITTYLVARSPESAGSAIFDVNINGENIQNIYVPGINMESNTFAEEETATNAFTTEQDTLLINIQLNPTDTASQGWLDFIGINAKRELIMHDSQMSFRDMESTGQGNISKFTISGISDTLVVWEVTDPLNIKKQEFAGDISGGEVSFILHTDSLREFIAFDTESYLTPAFVEQVENQNLHGLSPGEMIIIIPASFEVVTSILVQHHISHDSLDIRVVDVDKIYNEFSSGVRDVSAIRDFVKMLWDRADNEDEKPKYLLLIGDASYDYKDRINDNTNIIPVFQSENSLSSVNSYISDDFFGLLDDSDGGECLGFLDISIGRIPARTSNEAYDVIKKIIHYDTHPQCMDAWRNDICFVADDEDNNGHMINADYYSQQVDSDQPVYNINKIYLDSYLQINNTYPEATTAVNHQVENGALIINYIGHGSDTSWAHENVTGHDDISGWVNPNNLPLFISVCGLFGNFDDPAMFTGSEHLLMKDESGAIAAISAVRLTYAGANFIINDMFYNHCFEEINGQMPRIGDILTKSKINSGYSQNKRRWVLLGDPAVRLAYPKHNVITTNINDMDAGTFNDTLFANTLIKINGQIEDKTGQFLGDYNGTLFVKVFDKKRECSTLANDGGAVFDYVIQDSIVWEGETDVLNGEFEFEFTVPEHIDPLGFGEAKISYYAKNSNEDANGYYSNLIIGGDSVTGFTDPVIVEDLNVFPLPASNILNLDLSLINTTEARAEIYDIYGKQVYSERFGNLFMDNTVQINISGFSEGIYIILLTTEDKNYRAKFVKMN